MNSSFLAALLLRYSTHRSDNPGAAVITCAIFFFVGILTFIRGFRVLQRRRLILDTPFSKIRSASMGMVEVSGLAVGPHTMIAPITARACYYYRTLVWELQRSGKNEQWVKVAGECMHVPFFVDDNTGRMLVDPRGADLDLHRDFEQEFSDSFFTTKGPAPPNVISFLARQGVATRNKIKVEEWCIKPKNSLFVLGTLSENPGTEVGPQPIRDETVNSFTPQGFSLSVNSLSFSMRAGAGFATGSPDYQLAMQHNARSPAMPMVPSTPQAQSANAAQQEKVTAALLKAGISSPAAWAAAGVSPAGASEAGVQAIADPEASAVSLASGPGTACAAPAAAFDPHPPVVLMKGTNNKAFLISWRSQQEVARSLGWQCTLMIWGGPAIALVSLYFFLAIEHLL